ncbi:type I restriction-modification system subunit M [Candidatus Saccharibacteria bacterium]|nr:type I restriction-modification system subunit M [Candidatus Saccharibacteria bacterium]
MSKYSQSELNQLLWSAADSSRAQVDAAIYKDYALTMLFYKYISDKSKAEYAKYLERFSGDKERAEAKMRGSRFYLPAGSSFDEVYMQKDDDNIGEHLNIALRAIESQNRAKLEGVFSVDFNSEAILGNLDQRNKMIRNLLDDFYAIDLSEEKEDIIGNSYMYLIEQFGSQAGKKAGEFFTRHEVAELVARLARPRVGDRICDPACGSGGLLLLAGAEIEKSGSRDYALYGQESNGSTYQLARMNMFLHGMDSTHLEWGDTLNNPLLLEDDQLMKFDICVANPPFSLDKWGAESAENDKFNRFWRGVPPKSKGDYAFISHIVETLRERIGRMAIVVPHGVLFRGAAEGKIRKQLIDENLIDAVVGLPAGLFQTTGIPVAIVIIDKARAKGGEREGEKDILFIEASKEFKAGKAMNILKQSHTDKIYETFAGRKELEKFSRRVPISEVVENDYNLNITRYVDTFEEEAEIDIKATLAEIDRLTPQIAELDKKMRATLKELGIE